MSRISSPATSVIVDLLSSIFSPMLIEMLVLVGLGKILKSDKSLLISGPQYPKMGISMK